MYINVNCRQFVSQLSLQSLSLHGLIPRSESIPPGFGRLGYGSLHRPVLWERLECADLSLAVASPFNKVVSVYFYRVRVFCQMSGLRMFAVFFAIVDALNCHQANLSYSFRFIIIPEHTVSIRYVLTNRSRSWLSNDFSSTSSTPHCWTWIQSWYITFIHDSIRVCPEFWNT